MAGTGTKPSVNRSAAPLVEAMAAEADSLRVAVLAANSGGVGL